MTVATGLDFERLGHLGAGELATISDEVDRQSWGMSEELLATIAELLHHILRVHLTVHSKKGTKIPAPLTIPRPKWDEEEPEEAEIIEEGVTIRMYRRALLGGGRPDGL